MRHHIIQYVQYIKKYTGCYTMAFILFFSIYKQNYWTPHAVQPHCNFQFIIFLSNATHRATTLQFPNHKLFTGHNTIQPHYYFQFIQYLLNATHCANTMLLFLMYTLFIEHHIPCNHITISINKLFVGRHTSYNHINIFNS